MDERLQDEQGVESAREGWRTEESTVETRGGGASRGAHGISQRDSRSIKGHNAPSPSPGTDL